MTLLFIVLAIVPIVQVESRLLFALKLSSVVIAANIAGFAIFRRKSAPASGRFPQWGRA